LTLETNFLLRLMKKSFASGCRLKKFNDSYENFGKLCCEKLVETGRNHRNRPKIPMA
jgi:hypothetical protein